jgi:putative SOS response-associated peptidase YedK
MCGRYSLTQTPDEWTVIYPEGEKPPLSARYNVAPSQYMPVIPMSDPQHVYLYRWGLIPHWAKDLKIGYRMINARSETVLAKPAFRGSMRKMRCLVPADGFYEWKRTEGGKQPYRIRLKEQAVFHFAGLYANWHSPEGKSIWSYTILTTEPNELMVDIHDRMPVILSEEDKIRWLDPREKPEELLDLYRPFPAERMDAYPVSPAVGNVRNDGPELIQPYEPPPNLFG